MRPYKIVHFDCVVVNDGVRNILILMALDDYGRLWQREMPNGEWIRIDQ